MISGDVSEQSRWESKADEVLRKPANAITTDDAKDLTSKEVSWPFVS